MRTLKLKETGKQMLRDESGTATLNWLSFGMAVLLFLAMTKLEGLIYVHTGGGFLLP